MDPVVQWVRTLWTKKSRGGAHAARRNATPVAFPLPDGAAPLVHEVLMREEDDFRPQATVKPVCCPTQVRLERTEDRLEVELVVQPEGMPRRWYRPSRVTLQPGEWLRWQINYRFSGENIWWYRQDTLNLCFGDATPDIFLGSPSRFVDERRHLR